MPMQVEAPENEQHESSTIGKPPLVVESLKEEPGAGWPSLGTLIADLLKLAIEGVGKLLLSVVPQRMHATWEEENRSHSAQGQAGDARGQRGDSSSAEAQQHANEALML